MQNLPLFPPQASSLAADVDYLYFFIVAISVFFTVTITLASLYFAIRYRREKADEVGAVIHGSLILELTWSIIPLLIVLVIFFWSASVYFDLSRAPANAMEIHAIGKRWMWKFQHPTGAREINELHVPVGQPIKVLIGSEDVLHSLYFPEFRTKMDAVPGRFTSLWFEATRPGRYRVFCAEYCGTNHSGMIGSVVVMEQPAYQEWLATRRDESAPAVAGERLFRKLACDSCHVDAGEGRGPSLTGVYGSRVRLQGGGEVLVDDNYVRESIVNPQRRLVEGYQPLMPTFQGLVSEEGLMQLVAYIKARSPQTGVAPTTPRPAPEIEP